MGEIGPLVVIITLVEFFHSGTLAQTLMSGSFKGSREGWACIIFNTSDLTLLQLSEALLIQTPCWVTAKLKMKKSSDCENSV